MLSWAAALCVLAGVPVPGGAAVALSVGPTSQRVQWKGSNALHELRAPGWLGLRTGQGVENMRVRRSVGGEVDAVGTHFHSEVRARRVLSRWLMELHRFLKLPLP